MHWFATKFAVIKSCTIIVRCHVFLAWYWSCKLYCDIGFVLYIPSPAGPLSICQGGRNRGKKVHSKSFVCMQQNYFCSQLTSWSASLFGQMLKFTLAFFCCRAYLMIMSVNKILPYSKPLHTVSEINANENCSAMIICILITKYKRIKWQDLLSHGIPSDRLAWMLPSCVLLILPMDRRGSSLGLDANGFKKFCSVRCAVCAYRQPWPCVT